MEPKLRYYIKFEMKLDITE